MPRPRALENIRVVDFSWVRAGPWATRWLGALGAEIIKIEWPENERGRLPSSTTPQDVDLSRYDLVGLAMQVFWICVGILIFSVAWRKAIRQYSAVSG